jgi:hypothetical protein
MVFLYDLAPFISLLRPFPFVSFYDRYRWVINLGAKTNFFFIFYSYTYILSVYLRGMTGFLREVFGVPLLLADFYFSIIIDLIFLPENNCGFLLFLFNGSSIRSVMTISEKSSSYLNFCLVRSISLSST